MLEIPPGKPLRLLAPDREFLRRAEDGLFLGDTGGATEDARIFEELTLTAPASRAATCGATSTALLH